MYITYTLYIISFLHTFKNLDFVFRICFIFHNFIYRIVLFTLFTHFIHVSIDAQEDLGGNEFEQRRKWNAMEFATKKGLTLVGVTFFIVDG